MEDGTLVVPARGGRLRPRRDRDAGHDQDLVDDVLDDLFGEPDDRGPGAADAVLLAAGLALAAATVLLHVPAAVGWAGAALVLLGLVLPARWLLRRVRGRRGALRLDASDPWVDALVISHDRVVDAVADPTSDVGREALAVAHLAVVEAASLLGGARTVAAAEREYCAERTAGLAALAQALAESAGAAPEEARRRGRRAEALRDLERGTGVSALGRLQALARELDEGGARA